MPDMLVYGRFASLHPLATPRNGPSTRGNGTPRAAVQLETDLSQDMTMLNYLLNTTEPTAHIPWRLTISLLGPWVDATEDRPIIALQAGIGVVGKPSSLRKYYAVNTLAQPLVERS